MHDSSVTIFLRSVGCPIWDHIVSLKYSLHNKYTLCIRKNLENIDELKQNKQVFNPSIKIIAIVLEKQVYISFNTYVRL